MKKDFVSALAFCLRGHLPSIERARSVSLAVLPFIIGAIPVLFWFYPGHIIYFTDETFPFRPVQNLQAAFSVWSSSWNFGGPYAGVTFLPYFAAMAALGTLLPLWASQAMLWYMVVAGSGLGASLLARKLPIDGRLPSIIAGLAYMYSSYWIYAALQDPYVGVIFYSLLPWYLLLFDSFLRIAKLRRGFPLPQAAGLIGLAFLDLPAFSSPYLFVLPIALIVYLVTFISTEYPNWKTGLRLAGAALLLLGMTLVTLGYWLYVTVYVSTPTGGQSIQPGSPLFGTLQFWLTLNSRGPLSTLLNTPVTPTISYPPVFGWSWFPVLSTPPVYPLLYALLPLLGFSALLSRRLLKSRIGLSLAIYLGLFLFFQNGVATPTHTIDSFVIRVVPLWIIFDNPYLWFSPVTTLCLSLLFGYTLGTAIKWLTGVHTKNKPETDVFKLRWSAIRTRQEEDPIRRHHLGWRWARPFSRYSTPMAWVALGAVFITAMAPSYPLFSGTAVPSGTPSSKVILPQYELHEVSFLNAQGNQGLVLELPIFVGDSEANWTSGGYFGVNPMYYQLTRPFLNSLAGMTTAEVTAVQFLLVSIKVQNSSDFHLALSTLDVSEILVCGDCTQNPAQIVEPFNLTRTTKYLSSELNLLPPITFGPDRLFQVVPAPRQLYAANSLDWPASQPSPRYVETPISFPTKLISASPQEPYSTRVVSSNQWGSQFDYVASEGTDGEFLADFNDTVGATWPFLVVILGDSTRVNISSWPYLLLSYHSSNVTSFSVLSGTYGSPLQPLSQVASNESDGIKTEALSLRDAGSNINNITFTISAPPKVHASLVVTGMALAQSIVTAGLSWSYTDFGSNYSHLGVLGAHSLSIYFNRTAGHTWPYFEAIGNGSVVSRPLEYSYLELNYTTSDCSQPNLSVANESGNFVRLTLTSVSIGEAETLAYFSLQTISFNVTEIGLFVAPIQTTRCHIIINSMTPVVARSSMDSLWILGQQPHIGAAEPQQVVTGSSKSYDQAQFVNVFSITRVNPTYWRFTASVNESSAFILVFPETFDSHWKLTLKGNNIVFVSPDMVCNGMFNGWGLVVTRGNLTGEIVYDKQPIFDGFVVVSGISVSLISGILVAQVIYRMKRPSSRYYHPPS